MIEKVWEFISKENATGQLVLVFGPGGGWSQLFSNCQGFRGTTLLRDENDRQRYLAIEMWDTLANRDLALSEYRAEFADMLTTIADLTENRRDLGSFRILAQATVKPSRNQRRRKTG